MRNKTLILCLLGTLSCNKVQEDRYAQYTVVSDGCEIIDVTVNNEHINAPDILDSLTGIYLETNDDCLIGEIDKFEYNDNKLYVLDCRLAKSLFCFDSTGRFERKFGKMGQGPDEYIEPTDFVVTSSHVVILDQFAHRLLFFDKAGAYSHSVKLLYKIHGITSLGNDTLFLAQAGDNRHYSDLHHYEIFTLNDKGEIGLKGLKNPYKMNYGSNLSKRMNNRTYYHTPLSNSIYEVTDSTVKERYRLNILNSPLPDDFEKSCNGDFENFMKYFDKKYNYFSGQFLETENYCLFAITNTDKMPIVVIYDKKTKTSKTGMLVIQGGGNEIKINKLMHIAFSLSFRFMTVEQDRIMGYISSSYLSDEGDDNPVIVSFKIK